jgi:hypothetical protein
VNSEPLKSSSDMPDVAPGGPLVGNTFDSYFISSDTTSNMRLNSVEAPVDTNLKSASDMSSRIDKKMKIREGAETLKSTGDSSQMASLKESKPVIQSKIGEAEKNST